jgi:hypothetical protein
VDLKKLQNLNPEAQEEKNVPLNPLYRVSRGRDGRGRRPATELWVSSMRSRFTFLLYTINRQNEVSNKDWFPRFGSTKRVVVAVILLARRFLPVKSTFIARAILFVTIPPI